MNAIITRGKRRGNRVQISQHCNDWFSVEGEQKPFRPSSLAFTIEGLKELEQSKCGMLFSWFNVTMTKMNYGEHKYTFKRRR